MTCSLEGTNASWCPLLRKKSQLINSTIPHTKENCPRQGKEVSGSTQGISLGPPISVGCEHPVYSRHCDQMKGMDRSTSRPALRPIGRPSCLPATHDPSSEIPRSRACPLLGEEGCVFIPTGREACPPCPLPGLQSPSVQESPWAGMVGRACGVRVGLG